jgi:oligoribonuclease
MSTTNIVWVDCEMTGLDLVHDALIELAVLVTDDELNILGEGVDVVIKPPDAALEQMDDFVRTMHTTSSLLDELADGITLAEAEEQALAYIRQYVTEPRKAPMAGNSIATDRNFITRDMTTLDAFLHYRMIDVSSVKELARRWYPRAYFQAPSKHGGHRALADITESINELAYYRAAVFVPPPGPDTATAKSIAAQLSAAPGQPTPSPQP